MITTTMMSCKSCRVAASTVALVVGGAVLLLRFSSSSTPSGSGDNGNGFAFASSYQAHVHSHVHSPAAEFILSAFADEEITAVLAAGPGASATDMIGLGLLLHTDASSSETTSSTSSSLRGSDCHDEDCNIDNMNDTERRHSHSIPQRHSHQQHSEDSGCDNGSCFAAVHKRFGSRLDEGKSSSDNVTTTATIITIADVNVLSDQQHVLKPSLHELVHHQHHQRQQTTGMQRQQDVITINDNNCRQIEVLSYTQDIIDGELVHSDGDTSTFDYHVYSPETKIDYDNTGSTQQRAKPIGVYTGVSKTIYFDQKDNPENQHNNSLHHDFHDDGNDNDWDCIGTGVFHLDPNPSTGAYESQIVLTVTCSGLHNTVIGGTGRFDGVIGGTEVIYESPNHTSGLVSTLTVCW